MFISLNLEATVLLPVYILASANVCKLTKSIHD
jgi:hypothetical protein